MGKSGVCAHLYVRAPSLLDQPVRTKEDGIREGGALMVEDWGQMKIHSWRIHVHLDV